MAGLVQGTAFITGAASGIGQYTALAFARYGITNLALADINLEALETTSKQLQAQFPKVNVLRLQVDVQSGEQVKATVAAVVARFGRLDIAVNNAGIGGSGKPTHEVDEEEWRRVINIDLDGVWRCQKEELAVMVSQEDRGPRDGRGRIINTASMYGIVAPGSRMAQTAYAAAKHGVVGLTKGDGNTYGPHNIRVNCICPGYVETPLLLRTMSTNPDSPLGIDIARTPLKRMCAMEEIADAIVFLASRMSSFMQGAALISDGGFTTQ
ncbi:short chain dehydrogenase/reductase family oxidoreductase [Sporothrix brasiliensis 5110]|uniref:Short chain dehydrogenase/reductase family oxidoreductase n=1 Tax=Sporothrix brasiliensis 5110 TaxID=1398154 RepID=A0A0C2EN42_9PEZI|nr:short chain dehydrogenase/reductase family oxidoreductase [Sporothrix brasiliensis 5110]KIH87544.1 short chain dehydrogenase/reductase family oxidoreductase [Sporothrix brasiliensis 5110]